MQRYDVRVAEAVNHPLVTIPAGQNGELYVWSQSWRFAWPTGVGEVFGDDLRILAPGSHWEGTTSDGILIRFLVWWAPEEVHETSSSEQNAMKSVSPDVSAPSEQEILSNSSRRLELLAKAASLRDQGILAEEEFQCEKERILAPSFDVPQSDESQ